MYFALGIGRKILFARILSEASGLKARSELYAQRRFFWERDV